MADYKEEIIQNLVTKFSIDREAVEAVIQETQKILKQQRQVTQEELTFEDKDYAASLEMRRQSMISSFDAQEQIIRNWFAKKLELAKSNAEEEKRIMLDQENDLQKLSDRRNEALGEQEKGHRTSLHMGEEQKGLLRALGFSDFVGFLGAMSGPMAMLTYLGTGLTQAYERIREARVEGTRIAIAAGMEPEAGFMVGQSLLELAKTKGASREDVTSVMKAFAPIASAGGVGARGLGELAGEAFDVGRVTGVAPADAARLMTQFRILEDVPTTQLKNRFLEVDAAAKDAGITTQTFVGWLTSAIDSGKMYNVSVEETKNLLLMFSRELRDGTLTVQQITTAQQAVGRSPEGFRALIGAQMAEQGGPVAEYFKSIGAESPMGQATAIRAIGEGMLISPTGELYKPEEGSPEGGRLSVYRQLVEKAYADYVTSTARRLSESPAEYAGMVEKVAGMPGIRGDTLFATQEMLKAIGVDPSKMAARTGEELLENAKLNQRAAEKMLEAANIQLESQTLARQFWNAQQRGFERTILGFQAFAATLRGDEEAAKRYRDALDQVGAEDTEMRVKSGLLRERRAGARERSELETKLEAGAYVWGGTPLINLMVENKTGTSLDFKVKGKNVVPTHLPGTTGAR